MQRKDTKRKDTKLESEGAEGRTRKDTKLESEGAEFLVLGQLLARGIGASKSYNNQRGYDLVAFPPKTKWIATIQVKSR